MKLKPWRHFISYQIRMESSENIESKIQKTEKDIRSLDNKLNTDNELLANSWKIKLIYKDICDLDKSIKLINDDNEKQELKHSLFEIKRLFADLMMNGEIDKELDDVEDEWRLDSVNEYLMHNLENTVTQILDEIHSQEPVSGDIVAQNSDQIQVPESVSEDIIAQNFDKIHSTEISVKEAKDKLLNSDFTYELVESLDKALTDEEKIILLSDLAKDCIKPEYISLLALWFWFQTWVLEHCWKEWNIIIPYINYWSGVIIIDCWEVIYGADYETAYTNYIIENTEIVEQNESVIKIKFWKYASSITYTIDTDNLEERAFLAENLKKGIDRKRELSIREFIHKFGQFSQIELTWWRDSVRAELYGKLTVWLDNFKLWYWVWLSYTHRWDNITSTTSISLTDNLVAFSSKWPQWKNVCRFDLTQQIAFNNGFFLQWKAYHSFNNPKGAVDFSGWYKDNKSGVEVTVWGWTNGAVISVKYNIPSGKKGNN